MSPAPVSVAVVGLGGWGPNLARSLDALPGCQLRWCCEEREQAREVLSRDYGRARLTGDLDEVLADPELDAVVLATPVLTHSALAVRVLDAGKHCFVEKPLAHSVAEAQRVVAAAERSERVLMVGHLLEYHPGVRKLKQIVEAGELGTIHYVYSHRCNVGRLPPDESVLWGLGPHDISALLYLAEEEPADFAAHGASYTREGVEDVVFGFMRFPSGLCAHLHLSWLDPHKERRFTVVGSRRMATFDDMAVEGRVTVYDRGFDEKAETYGEYITRSGDIWSPRIPNHEPLRLECAHFLGCIRSGRPPLSDGRSGLRVVRVLERLQAELEASRPRVGAVPAASS